MKSYISLAFCIFLLFCSIEKIYSSSKSSNFRRSSSSRYRQSNSNKEDDNDSIRSIKTSSSSREKDDGGALQLVGSLGLIGAIGVGIYYGLSKLVNYIKEKKEKDLFKLSPYIDTSKLLEGVLSASTGTTTKIDDDSYVCLIFDCDTKLPEIKDKKARVDYFNLMANITSNVSKGGNNKMSTVYIPGKGNGNIIEETTTKKSMSHWSYFNSKHSGEAASIALRKKFSVRPEELRIVMLDSKGKVVSENALDLLRIDPKGMPWPPRSVLDIIGKSFLQSAGGALVDDIGIKGKTIGLYFSASWCKPCSTFSPKLAKAYEVMSGRKAEVNGTSDELTTDELITEIIEEGKNTEIIFVSLDQEEEAFDTYRSSMPWPSIPFRDVRRALLQLGLGIKSIPALVFIDPEGRILTSSGVTELLSDEPLTKFPWSEINVDLSSGSMVEKLQRSSAVVALTENCDNSTKLALQETMKRLGGEFNKPVLIPRSPRDGELLFCVLEQEGKLSEIVRKICLLPKANVKKNAPELILVDFINEEFAVGPILNNNGTDFEELSLSGVKEFAENYRNYNMPMSPFAKLAGSE